MNCDHPEWGTVFPLEDIEHPWLRGLKLDRYMTCEYCDAIVFKEDTGKLRTPTDQEENLMWGFFLLIIGEVDWIDGQEPPALIVPGPTYQQAGRERIAVRVSMDARDFAKKLGKGVAADGVRRAVSIADEQGWRPEDLDRFFDGCATEGYTIVKPTLNKKERGVAIKAGRGNFQRGVRRILEAVKQYQENAK